MLRRPIRGRLTFPRWEHAHTADGQRYKRCARSLKEFGCWPGGALTGA